MSPWKNKQVRDVTEENLTLGPKRELHNRNSLSWYEVKELLSPLTGTSKSGRRKHGPGKGKPLLTGEAVRKGEMKSTTPAVKNYLDPGHGLALHTR